MELLQVERETLARYLPDLDGQLAELPFTTLEERGGPGIKLFRDAGGPGLLVPTAYRGLGASPVDAVRVQRAIGSRAPSLAIASTMHHFSVTSLIELARAGTGLEWVMVEAIATEQLLLSSAFAEGRTGQHILSPTMRARRVDGGYRVSGSKKPCSLTASMDLLSASVTVAGAPGDGGSLAVILVAADSEGIERRPFWGSWVLGGAESDEVVLDDVFVPDALVYRPATGPGMDPIHIRGFAWFELLVSASYLGMASALAERVVRDGRGSDDERALLGVELESSAAALERVAAAIGEEADETLLTRALWVRYATERAIERVTMQAAALAGGMAFIGSSDVAYLLAASRALAFHPPSRSAAATTLAGTLAGGALSL